jgi:hypothetical protein
MNNQRPTALVTGASGGIGRDLALELATRGFNLIVVARSAGKLEALQAEIENAHGVAVTVITQDLAPIDAAGELYKKVEEAGLTVDVLVNNAGFATYGRFHELPLEREQAMMQLNMVTLTELTHLFLQGMIARGHGRILNVASTAAFQPGPLMAVYYASKAYVLHFSEAIANELQDSGVTVTALCPGPTASGFQSRADMESSRLVQNGLMESRVVARAGIDALLDGKRVEVPGLANKLGALAPRFVPRHVATKVVRSMQAETH